MILLTAPIAEPVTLDEAKAAARISGSAHDALLPGLITSARQSAEHITGRCLMEQTRRFEMFDWPGITDPLPVPDASAVAISYWSGSAWVSLSGGAFEFAPLFGATVVAPVSGTSWPTLGTKVIGARVRIDITAGAETADDVPECVKLYIKALVAWWVDNPSAVADGRLQEAPFLANLLDPVRVWA